MTSAPVERFRSKVDWWLAIIVASVPLISAGTAVAGTLAGDVAAALIGWGTVLATILLYFAVVWPVEYEVGEGVLVIRFGLMRSRVPLAQLTRIAPSRNPLASPALSLDRLRIDRRGGGFLLVSPADRSGFARAILDRHGDIDVDRDLLRTRGGSR